MAAITGLTIEDFEQLPDEDAHNQELVDGELVDVSGNTLDHNRLRDAIVIRTDPFVRQNKLGMIVSEQEFAFGEDAHGPDVSFLGPEKAGRMDLKRRVQPFVPDLAIEIISENEKFSKLFAKTAKYWRFGVKEIYVFSIVTRQIFVCGERPAAILNESDDFRPEIIPGFSIRVGDLFGMI